MTEIRFSRREHNERAVCKRCGMVMDDREPMSNIGEFFHKTEHKDGTKSRCANAGITFRYDFSAPVWTSTNPETLREIEWFMRKTDASCSKTRRCAMTPFERFVEYAHSVDVRVRLVNELPDYDWRLEGRQQLFEPPFDLASILNWQRKIIFVQKSATYGLSVGALIHELGHVVASPKNPDECDEYAFLGWEWCVAKKIDCRRQWMKSMQRYSIQLTDFKPSVFYGMDAFVNEHLEFGVLKPVDKKRCVQAAVERALEHKLITSQGEPMVIR
jgi:transcription initiation factor TFIIIB Brf1 subunit/transcription initiation factor TFIIB